jgi:DNA-binding NtrC family response regulator
VGELPLTTQVRLLRVLEMANIKVGSSQKTTFRIVTAATNVNYSMP